MKAVFAIAKWLVRNMPLLCFVLAFCLFALGMTFSFLDDYDRATYCMATAVFYYIVGMPKP